MSTSVVKVLITGCLTLLEDTKINWSFCLYGCLVYHYFIFFGLHFYNFIYCCMFCVLLFNCVNCVFYCYVDVFLLLCM
jgi:hypothetical protein